MITNTTGIRTLNTHVHTHSSSTRDKAVLCDASVHVCNVGRPVVIRALPLWFEYLHPYFLLQLSGIVHLLL